MKERANEMIGKMIRKKRKERGYTQDKLAEKAGVNSKSIYRIENGIQTPGVEMLSRLGNALGTDLQSLIDGSEPIDLIGYEKELEMILHGCSWSEKKFIFGLLRYVIDNIKELEG